MGAGPSTASRASTSCRCAVQAPTPCENDFLAAYYNALMYGITGQETHADKAMEIIHAYATTLQRVELNAPLCAGLQGFILANACELMRSGYKGWTANDTRKT